MIDAGKGKQNIDFCPNKTNTMENARSKLLELNCSVQSISTTVVWEGSQKVRISVAPGNN